jgi:hypothetical protein
VEYHHKELDLLFKSCLAALVDIEVRINSLVSSGYVPTLSITPVICKPRFSVQHKVVNVPSDDEPAKMSRGQQQ